MLSSYPCTVELHYTYVDEGLYVCSISCIFVSLRTCVLTVPHYIDRIQVGMMRLGFTSVLARNNGTREKNESNGYICEKRIHNLSIIS